MTIKIAIDGKNVGFNNKIVIL